MRRTLGRESIQTRIKTRFTYIRLYSIYSIVLSTVFKKKILSIHEPIFALEIQFTVVLRYGLYFVFYILL